MEITLTTPNALAAIREATRKLGERATIGAGTVLDSEACRAALAAGAEFIVTPICRPELVAIAHAAQRPIILGAFTPTEAQLAHEAGADFIKIFPADSLGLGYIKACAFPCRICASCPRAGLTRPTSATSSKPIAQRSASVRHWFPLNYYKTATGRN